MLGPLPPDCVLGGRPNGKRRVLSGCRVSPKRPIRLASTFITRRASSWTFESDDEVVRISDQHRFASHGRQNVSVEPQIEHVVQINIAQWPREH